MKKTQKKISMLLLILAIVAVSSSAIASEESYYVVPGVGHQFAMYSNNSGELWIWGSSVQTATGYSPIRVNASEAPLSVILSWYTTLLANQITGGTVRIIYESTTGRIVRIVPPME
jgi:hypothetical protein